LRRLVDATFADLVFFANSGAEIEIALAFRRHQPAALAALESDIGAGIGRHDGGCRVGSFHLSNSLYRLEIPASRGRRADAAK
jgi:hypothetical protein